MAPRRDEEGWRRAEREAFDRTGDPLRLADAVAGMVATAGPLALGVALDHPHAGLVVGLGGMNVALAMGTGRPRARAPWGAITMVMGALVTGLATLAHPWGWVSAVLAFAVCGVGATSRVLGRAATLVGFVVSASFLITNGLPGSVGDAVPRAGQYLLGGALGVALMAAAATAERTGAAPSVGRPALASLPGLVRARPEVRRHAVVVATTIGLTVALDRALALAFGYWIPLTALAVLQPEVQASRVRVVQRASGTLVGALAVAIPLALSPAPGVLVAGVAVASSGLFALRERSYHWLVTFITPTVLLMISVVDPEGDHIVVSRLSATASGLAASLLAIAVLGWPTRRTSPPTP